MTRLVLSERAEAATTELMQTLAAHERWKRTHLPKIGRLGLFRPVPAPENIHHLTLPHIAAVAEEFARATLLEASEPLVPRTHKILELLWQRAESQAEQWDGVANAWSQWHGITVKQEPRYKTLEGVIAARNAIVHGLGRLTRKQTRSDGGASVRDTLARVGITTAGTRLVVSDDSVRQCVQAARAFIEWLDNRSITGGLRPLRGGR